MVSSIWDAIFSVNPTRALFPTKVTGTPDGLILYALDIVWRSCLDEGL